MFSTSNYCALVVVKKKKERDSKDSSTFLESIFFCYFKKKILFIVRTEHNSHDIEYKSVSVHLWVCIDDLRF